MSTRPPLTTCARVEIVIPVFNQLDYTRDCLLSLEKHSPATKIILIDNGSTDGTGDFLAAKSNLIVIHNPWNLGCAAAWNLGVKTAGDADWVAILNNDIVVSANWLEGLLSAAADFSLDIVSPALREGPLNYAFEDYVRDLTPRAKNLLRPGAAHGICFLVSQRVFKSVGVFDENFHIGQFEDADFFERARRSGFKLGTTGRSFIHHFGSATQNDIRRDKSVTPYEARNRAYFRQKWQLTWPKRQLERFRSRVSLAWWRARERRECGHALWERWCARSESFR
jgi:GT2 family glycosyltransferase